MPTPLQSTINPSPTGLADGRLGNQGVGGWQFFGPGHPATGQVTRQKTPRYFVNFFSLEPAGGGHCSLNLLAGCRVSSPGVAGD
jgi:hypothetical protein